MTVASKSQHAKYMEDLLFAILKSRSWKKRMFQMSPGGSIEIQGNGVRTLLRKEGALPELRYRLIRHPIDEYVEKGAVLFELQAYDYPDVGIKIEEYP